MKNKKVFRKNLFFRIMLYIGFPLYMSFLPCGVVFLILSFTVKEILWAIPFNIAYVIGCLWLWKNYIIPTLIPSTFGKLIITDEGVEFRCLFKKATYISWKDCEYCGIESYHSDVKDLYMTGRMYVYFATKPIPRERQNKLDMMKNTNECIKFFPVDKKLCNEILLHTSAHDIRRALFQNKIRW